MVVLLAGLLTIQEVINRFGWYDEKVIFSDGTIGLKYESKDPFFGFIFFFKNGEFVGVKPTMKG